VWCALEINRNCTGELQGGEQVVNDVPKGQPVVLVHDDAGEQRLLDIALSLKYFKYVHLNNTVQMGHPNNFYS
jgi:hypothetical protein